MTRPVFTLWLTPLMASAIVEAADSKAGQALQADYAFGHLDAGEASFWPRLRKLAKRLGEADKGLSQQFDIPTLCEVSLLGRLIQFTAHEFHGEGFIHRTPPPATRGALYGRSNRIKEFLSGSAVDHLARLDE